MNHLFLRILAVSILALAVFLAFASCKGKTPSISLPEAYATADVVYECDDESVLYVFKGKTEEDFKTVCAYYKEQGLQVYSNTTKEENRFTTFVGNGPMAHIYWLKNDGELNIVLSETAANTLPPVTPAVTDGDYECSVVQLKDNENVNGMAYIIQLKDGSYIIYDGSYSSQANIIRKYLDSNYKGQGKPVIRAWVLTHSHSDHFPSFQTFCREMSDTAVVEHIVFSPLNDRNFTLREDNQGYFSSKQFQKDVANLKGVKIVYAHTGMEFVFCNLKLEVLMTPETLFQECTDYGNFNNTSVVTRLYDESYACLFLGDIAKLGADRMLSLYGDYLKSDMCQVSHHGVEDAPLSLYEAIQASILYYPCNIYLYNQYERHSDVRFALEERDYTKEILIAGCGEYKRAWGTVFDADAPLVIPDHPFKGPDFIK